MVITAELLKALNPKLTPQQAQINAAALQKAAVQFGITDPRSVAAWLANIAVESKFLAVRENMNYRDPKRARSIFSALARYPDSAFMGNPVALANIVYAGRLGNGNVASGDGWRYRGGGHIQNTGRNGYRVTGKAIGIDLEARPERIEEPEVAALAAAAYWTRLSSADRLARAGDIRGTRRAVNGPKMLHADEMMAYYAKAKALLNQGSDDMPSKVFWRDLSGPKPINREWDGKKPLEFTGPVTIKRYDDGAVQIEPALPVPATPPKK